MTAYVDRNRRDSSVSMVNPDYKCPLQSCTYNRFPLGLEVAIQYGKTTSLLPLGQGCPTFRLWRAAFISSLAWRACMQYRPLSRQYLNVNNAGLYLSNFIRGSKFWLLKSTTVLMHRYIESRPPLRFLIAAGGGQKFSRGFNPPTPRQIQPWNNVIVIVM